MKLFCWLLPVALCTTVGLAQESGDTIKMSAQEQAFQTMLSGVQLIGSFTDDAAPPDQPLSRDQYTLTKVEKVSDNRWAFHTRIQYGKVDITLPLVLPVEWAGDTPMVSLTDFTIPGMGTFTSRVLFYRGQYAGTWRGADHGGHLFGDILPLEDGEEEEAKGAGHKTESSSADDSQSSLHWPSFRGTRARGISDGYPLPISWSVENEEAIVFKSEIPGLAHSSPVIWDDRIFVTTAVGAGDADLKVGLYGSIEPVPDEGKQSHRVLCLDKFDGEVLWEQTAIEAVPKIKRHPKGSHAACTPVTDGQYVVAFFASEGLYCYDMDGQLLWNKDFGVLDTGYYLVKVAQWGSSSSPVLHDGKIILQCDVQDESFLIVLDAKSGDEIWRTVREEVPTWGTPTVDLREGRSQIICNGYQHIGGYDLHTGKELWSLVGGGDIPVPTPIVAHDLIYITNAHGSMAPLLAIEAMAEGVLQLKAEDCEDMRWSYPRKGIYMQTPLVYDDLLYCCSDAGILSCYHARTGEEIYKQRLGSGGSGFTASAVAGDDLLYFTSEEGEIYVIQAGRDFEVLAVNDMEETCMATPAISEGVLYFRTRGHLVAVGEGI
jgi:outer membrane protein assembly factor BamB